MALNFNKSAFFRFHAIGLSIVAFIYITGVWPVFSLSNSVPYNFFVGSKYYITDIKVGDYVLFKANVPGYKNSLYLVKEVAGVAGDSININNNNCYVNHNLIGAVHASTLSGIQLSPIKSRAVPDGKLFVQGTHNRSFDSRYEELGLIDVSKVKKAYGLF